MRGALLCLDDFFIARVKSRPSLKLNNGELAAGSHENEITRWRFRPARDALKTFSLKKRSKNRIDQRMPLEPVTDSLLPSGKAQGALYCSPSKTTWHCMGQDGRGEPGIFRCLIGYGRAFFLIAKLR